MPLPPHFVGKQATLTALVAAVVRTMREDHGHTQDQLAALLNKSRAQIGSHENNTLRARSGWTVEDTLKLDLAWSLPVGTVGQRCARAYQRLRRALVITDAQSASQSLSVKQLQQALACEDEHYDP